MQKTLKNIPKKIWIYKFIDKNHNIIYIWKSINLFFRVNSYFNLKTKLNFAKQKMVKQIKKIETIITNNETESIILETTLIKKYSPKYNILMKDGKNHLYIKITDSEYPQIIKTRIKNNKWTYFWPYISTFYVNNLLKLIKNIFWYWIWNHNFFLNKNNYNLDKYIFKNNLDINSYTHQINKIKIFLNWNTSDIKKELKLEMQQKAKNLEFESASKIKTYIESISIIEENQIVRDKINWNYIIYNIIEKFDNFYVWKIEINDWKMTGFKNFDIINNLNEDKDYILNNIIEKEIISNKTYIYILPKKINNNKIIVEIPKKWIKKQLLDMCYKNIYEYASKSHIESLKSKWFSKKTMKNLLDILWYKQINKNIIFECNDISHISWYHTVASRSIIENWKTNNSKYKKFKIKTLDYWKIDDFDSMREITTRRIKEIYKLKNTPDLIIIDWGKWQLSSVIEIIEKEKIKLQIVAIAKKEEELFLPNNKKSILLNKNSDELKLVQKLRDEAHRFAISFNRDSRNKSMKKNILESLPWFWPKTRKKLLNKYWSVEKLKNKKNLSDILNKTQIQVLEDHGIT